MPPTIARKQPLEGTGVDAAEHLALVVFLARLECASAFLVQESPSSFLVLVPLVRIRDTLPTFRALMLVSLIPLNPTCC